MAAELKRKTALHAVTSAAPSPAETHMRGMQMSNVAKEGDPVLGPQVRRQARVDVLGQELLHLHLNDVQPFRAEIAQNL